MLNTHCSVNQLKEHDEEIFMVSHACISPSITTDGLSAGKNAYTPMTDLGSPVCTAPAFEGLII